MGLRASVLITNTVLESVFSDGRRWQAPVAREPFLERRVSPSVRADRASSKVVRRLACPAAPRSYPSHCEPPPPQGRSSFVHRVQRVTSLVEARPHSRCPDGVERAARYVVPSAHPSRRNCSRQGRTRKQLVANRLHSQRNRADNMPGDPLLFVGCWLAHRNAPYNHSHVETRVTRPSLTRATSTRPTP